tara:strand:- start:147 stop:866 length:720 start_codon:yes stop_codon:yes gene_type:complete
MTTVCELKIQAKKRGLKGYSKMKKADLEKLLAGADKAKEVAQKVNKSKPASKPAPKPTSKPASKSKSTNKKYNVALPEFKSPITPFTDSRTWGFERSDIEEDGVFTPKAKLIEQLEDFLKRIKSLGEGGAGEAGAIEKQLDWVKKNYNPPPPKSKPKASPPKDDPKQYSFDYYYTGGGGLNSYLNDLMDSRNPSNGRKLGFSRAKSAGQKYLNKMKKEKKSVSKQMLKEHLESIYGNYE